MIKEKTTENLPLVPLDAERKAATLKKFLELKEKGLLPSIKGVALSIVKATTEDNVSLSQIANIVTPDVALTARLIKLANSALGPGARPIASLSDALKKLGVSQIRKIALSFALVDESKGQRSKHFDYDKYWAQSLFRGALMRQACTMYQLGAENELFTLGLLSQVGELTLASAYPEEYDKILEKKLSKLGKQKEELRVLGIDSTMLSVHLMEDWSLPPPFIEAVRLLGVKRAQLDTAVKRVKELNSLLKNTDAVAKRWIDIKHLESVECIKALSPLGLELQKDLIAAGGRSDRISEELGEELLKGAIEETASWLENLNILIKTPQEELEEIQKLERKKEQEEADQQKKALEEIEAGQPDEPDDAQRVLELQGVKVLIGTKDEKSLKTIARAMPKKAGKIIALRTKEQMLDELITTQPHVLFIDFNLDEEFLHSLNTIRKSEMGKNVFLVALIKAQNENQVFPLLGQGIDDYLIKPFSLAQAHAKLSITAKLSSTVESIKESKESLRKVELELENSNKKLQQSSMMDNLTGLPNRNLFKDRLKVTLAVAKQHARATGVLLLDMDNFKTINDAFGHNVGDELIKSLGNTLKPFIKTGNTLARMGGDEFAIIVRNTTSAHLTDLSKRILKAVSGSVMLVEGKQIITSASIGIAMAPTDGDDVESLIKNADIALYASKNQGKSQSSFFQPYLYEKITKQYKIRTALSGALERQEFKVVFQPKVNLSTGHIGGAEALLRWFHPDLGFVPPDVFIPIAEETHYIEIIGAWVLEQSVKMCQRIRKAYPDFKIAVNLSSRQFKAKGLTNLVFDILKASQLPPAALELEITESVAMEDVFEAIKILEQLKKLGVKISLDDFGTGHSSLAYLKKLPIDFLKIDKGFVLNALTDKDDHAICKMVSALGHAMGKGLVAEGVEHLEHQEFVKELGVQQGQGYYYSRPISEEDFMEVLKKFNKVQDTPAEPNKAEPKK